MFFPSSTGVMSFRVQDHRDEVTAIMLLALSYSITCDTDLDHLSKAVFYCVYSLKSCSFSPLIPPFFFNVVAFAYLFSSFYFQLFWILFYTYCDTHIVGFLSLNLMHSISPFLSFPPLVDHLDWNGFSSHTKFSPVLVTKFYILLSF